MLPDPDPKLSTEQVAKRDALRKLREELQIAMMKLFDEKPESPEDDPEVTALEEQMMEVFEQLEPLEAGSNQHGWVWLYRRAPAAGN